MCIVDFSGRNDYLGGSQKGIQKRILMEIVRFGAFSLENGNETEIQSLEYYSCVFAY